MKSNIKLYNRDCIEVMDELIAKGVKVDLIITSPPYNLGHYKRNCGGVLVKYNSYKDDMDYDDYEKWQIEFLNKCYDLLSDRGLIYYNHKERHFKGKYFNPINLVQCSKLKPLQTIIWNRKSGYTFNIGRYVNCYESIIVAYKNIKKYMRIPIEQEKYFDVWNITPSKNNGQVATYPLELPLRILKGYKNYKDLLVLDPFMGLGTTGIACKKMGIDFIGIDIDKKYFDIVKQCLEDKEMEL